MDALRIKVNAQIKKVIVPYLRSQGFKGSFPHFRRISEDGRVDYLSFQFNKWGGSFIAEMAATYPYRGREGNFYYWDEVTPEFLKKSNCGYARERLRIAPQHGKWFEYNDTSYEEVVEPAGQMIAGNMSFLDRQAKKYHGI